MSRRSSAPDVSSLVYEAVACTNEVLEPEMRIEARSGETLIGPGAKLDSLGFVSLILEIETLVEARLGVTIELLNDRALSQERSPFRTIERLIEYVTASIDASAATAVGDDDG
jgi:acyl carrier protein